MIKRIFAAILAAALLSALLCSCSSTTIGEDEAKAIAEELIAGSLEINEIFFGEGLPTDTESEAIRSYYGILGIDIDSELYLPVSADARFTSIDGIKAAALEVYSADYCDYLFDMAFDGFAGEGGDVVFARYIEQYDLLTVYSEIVPLTDGVRSFDYSSIVIKKLASDYVLLTIDSSLGGAPSESILLKLVREKRPDSLSFGWYLDTPTY